ncbi:NAD-dependent epimerase/dehydratase family protein [Wenxinia marina]|uniref:Nucleoside-diphosphate-sugar epimerase n=1 Tax=Wenxinia marina DSM 24838 TaxID=1123501 RepID=A0A0D0QI20_9RHOB|nr:NAD-dependent epimerase/dehydratase family protein [Wenxinia marina]KIQ70673.1 Nucleoside-diphosphate-sugar epimerase [Wenxinia marina DSM 24838]GGL51392.1 nucleotide sugar epimerase [Wenxinia marina]
MARIVVIGGSGHVGTYLVPALVARGHEVVNVSRGRAAPYRPHPAWERVETVTLDRDAMSDADFADRIAALSPDVVIDMIAFRLSQTRPLVEALRGRVQHFLHCSTIWVYGHNAAQPATEDDPMNPFGEYGTDKAEIEAWLLPDARRTGFPAPVFRPGHIVGPGWAPLNPAANFNTEVFARIARGEELTLPNFGLETVHHVHAEDVAQVILCAMSNRSAALGEAFNAVSPQALNLRGYAEAMYRFFGHEPRLAFRPFDDWKAGWSDGDATATWEHIARSPCHSVAKGRERIGYVPRHSSLSAVEEAVRALVDAGKVSAPA